jgi:hypothetical protein
MAIFLFDLRQLSQLTRRRDSDEVPRPEGLQKEAAQLRGSQRIIRFCGHRSRLLAPGPPMIDRLDYQMWR